MYELYGIKIGEKEVDSYLLSNKVGEKGTTTIAYYFWCLKGPDGISIVDTGGAVEEAQKRGLLEIRRQEELLARIGVRPESVTRVILTHLHWDHFSRWEIFPKATFYVQKRDVDFFTGPMMKNDIIRRYCSNVADICKLQKDGRVQLIDGEETLAAGLRTLWVGGHTPGSQVVVVSTDRGTAVLCSDLYYLYCHIREDTASLIQLDIPECLAAFEMVKETASSHDLILPGHDPLLIKIYTNPGDGVAKVA